MAKLMQMPTRRFLFLGPRRKVTLAPIYVALLSLLAVALLGLLVAVWPTDSGPDNAQLPGDGSRAGDTRSFEGSYLPPPAPPKAPRSGTWM